MYRRQPDARALLLFRDVGVQYSTCTCTNVHDAGQILFANPSLSFSFWQPRPVASRYIQYPLQEEDTQVPILGSQ